MPIDKGQDALIRSAIVTAALLVFMLCAANASHADCTDAPASVEWSTSPPINWNGPPPISPDGAPPVSWALSSPPPVTPCNVTLTTRGSLGAPGSGAGAGSSSGSGGGGTGTPTGGSCTGDIAGGAWLSDSAAAAAVKPTGLSSVEKGPHGAANAAANAYYFNHQGAAYDSAVAGFQSYWKNDPVMSRVDGKCNLGPNPTTAEVLQWAARKWGLSPLVTYAEATDDGNWDMTSVGDYGCSIGVAQNAICSNAQRPNHAIRGLDVGQPGHALAIENTCFNVDMFAAAISRQLVGNDCANGNITLALSTWMNGPGSCTPCRYSDRMCASISNQQWTKQSFGGSAVPF